MGNSMIQSLWIGSGFSNNELLCMRSFLHHGQAFHLYVYEPMPGIPEGVEIREGQGEEAGGGGRESQERLMRRETKIPYPELGWAEQPIEIGMEVEIEGTEMNRSRSF